ncbi:hypothetical protein LEP1GSC013_2327 [Leptospira interrogans serovar Valbuzzi str. Duyster]|nr:hypothetical protein LEP1GSC013_2327 [Leptospira interrogans serovar Valbuzzi str. Duyster]ENO71588.1 hypothetical protein LEP1GSC012_0204 [Leptospira interrogans serovar Valbuzzi str. Valbuzzi]
MQKLEIHSFFEKFIYLLLFFIVSTLNAENFKLKVASYDTLTLYLLTKIEEIKDENGFSSRRIPRSDLDFQKIREHLLQIDADILAIQNLRNEAEALNILSEDYSCFVNKRSTQSHRGIGICWKKNKFPISNIQIHKADTSPFFFKTQYNQERFVELQIPIGKSYYSFWSVCLYVDKERRTDQLHLLNDLLRKNKNFFVLGNFNDPLSKRTLSWKTLSEGLLIFNTGRYVKQRCLKNKILTSLILTDLDLKQKLTPVPFSQNEEALLEAKDLLESCPVSLDVELQENLL